MRAAVFVLSMAMTTHVQALEVDCDTKAQELVTALTSYTNAQSEADVRSAAITFCQSIVNRAENERAQEANSAFEEWLKNGETADKEGNKRLKRKSH